MKRKEYLQHIGHALRVTREAQKVTQEAFANSIKMHRTYYSAVERGEKNLTVDTILRIARGLEEKPGDLLQLADEFAEL